MVHNLQLARPVKKVFFPWVQDELGQPRRGLIAYHSRNICYIIDGKDGSKIAIVDLQTGKKSIWDNEAGEPLSFLGLSDRYLVMAWDDG